MDPYRRNRMLTTVNKQSIHSKQTSKLNKFETKVDKGCFHLKTFRENFTCYLCSWSIRNFSLFEYDLSTGFQDENCFSYYLTLTVTEERLNINIYNTHHADHHYKSSITVSTDLGTVLFHRNLVDEEVSEESYTSPYERVSITAEDFQKLKQLPNDTLVLTCKLLHSGARTTPRTSMNRLVSSSKYLKTLQADLKQYSSASIKEKVQLCVGTETEFVNKAIICVRSPVFSKMFENDMQEIEENKVTITDIKMPVLKALVSFLYSGLVPDWDFDFLFDLYYSACKYQIAELQLACSKSLLGKVSLKNICKVLNLAFLHNDELFKSATMALISANLETIAMTAEWKNLMHHDPERGLMASTFFEF